MRTLEIPAPSEKQRMLLTDTHKYVAYGGARGGGKSWALRTKGVILALARAGIIIMIIRKTYAELRANHIDPLRAMLGNRIAKYNDARKEYTFPNGSVIKFRYCETERDMGRYQGTEADIICIDEATQFDENVFRMFAACLRGVNEHPKRIYLTCNPGGKGHGWVKRLFIDKAFKEDENPNDYSFIQAFVQDNHALMAAQPEYIKQLEALPHKLRDAWLYGKWDIFEGQFFSDFTDKPSQYKERTFTHVIEPFAPKKTWRRFRSFDFGYNKPFSVGWWAVDPDNVFYRILELYGCTGTPDEGVRWPVEQIFDRVARIEQEHEYLKGHHITGVADPSIWDASRGISIADTAAKYGIYFEKGDNKRLPGWMQMHYRFMFDENGYPMMYVFNTCSAFIRTIPLLTHDDLDPEDLDTTQEDHVADEVRYFCMSRPVTPRESELQPARKYNPLDLWQDDNSNDKNAIYRL